MAAIEKITIALTPEMAGAIRHAVEAGEYASTSEAIRDAVREWRARRSLRAQAVDELRRAWDAGVESGPASDGEAAFERVRERLEERIASART